MQTTVYKNLGVVGLEPTTSASRTLRASQLRYTPLIRGNISMEFGKNKDYKDLKLKII